MGLPTISSLSRTDALAMVDPRLLDVGLDTIAAILTEARGGHSAHQHLSAEHVDLMREHRVIPLLNPSWSFARTPPHLEIAAVQLLHDRLARDVIATLTHHSIDSRVLKGMATSQLDYPSPALRHSGDLDLLIRPQDFDKTVDVLGQLGFFNQTPAITPGDVGKGFALVGPDGLEVDLHTRLSKFSIAPTELLWERPAKIPAMSAYALPTDLRLIHASSHLMYSKPGSRRLSGLADIAAITTAWDVDLDALRNLSARMGIEALTGWGLATERLISGQDIAAFAQWAAPSRLEGAALLVPKHRPLLNHALGLWSQPTASRKLRYLRHLVVPGQQVLDASGGFSGYVAKFREALRR